MTSLDSPREYITVVSGLPRSGTSMVMQMLEAGGMTPLMDEHLKADIDNPGGYYEYEKISNIAWDNEWLGDAVGKCVKVLAAGVRHMPIKYDYKLIYIQRDADEMLISLKKLLIRSGVEPTMVDEDSTTPREQALMGVERWAEKTGNELLIVDYNDTLKNPRLTATAIVSFLGIHSTEIEPMATAVYPEYYRNRVVGI